MANESKKREWTPAEIKEEVRNIQKVIEEQKRKVKYEHFTSVTPEEIKEKLKRAEIPWIFHQDWNSTTPGGTVNYRLGIRNSTSTKFIWLFAHVWVGSGNIDPIVGTFLLNVDTRFPRLTQPQFTGLTLNPNSYAFLNFSLKVPCTVEKTNYLGNSCLMQFNWHDVGTYIDRSVFVFAVS